MDFASVLSQLLARTVATVAGLDIVTYSETADWDEGVLEALLALDLIRPAAPGRSVVCPACDEEHESELVTLLAPDGSPSRTYITCPLAGMVPVDARSQLRWRVRAEGLVQHLACELTGCAPFTIGPHLWHLGSLSRGGGNRDLLLYLGGSPLPAATMPCLARPLVLVADPEAGGLDLPHLALVKLLRPERGEASIDHDYLEAVLSSGRGAASPYLFRHEGQSWAIAYQGRSLPPLGNLVGLRHLAFLLQRPHQEFSPLVLIAEMELETSHQRAGVSKETQPRLAQSGLLAVEPSTLLRIKAGLKDCDARLTQAQWHQDDVVARRVQEERNAILREYLTSTDRWGKPRVIASAHTRAANSVTRAVTRAIRRLETYDMELGRHLDRCVARKSTCVYRPEDPAPAWVF